MKIKPKTRNALLIGGGFLAGSLGVKALTSKTAKKGYVKVVAQGMRAKSAYLDIVEQAKATCDDIVAEATYISSEKGEDACDCAEAGEDTAATATA